MEAFLVFIGWAYLLWVLFLAVMALQWRWTKLSKPVKVCALPLVSVAWCVDVGFNMVATVIFLDYPHELLFTNRLTRYIKTDDGWRGHWAKTICNHLLNPFDIGGHCV